MALPKIKTQILTFIVPSTKEKHRFRPFLVKEEKVLLQAKESSANNEFLGAILQVVNNCSLDPDLKVEELPIFDLEYLFLKLRGASVSNVIKPSYRDPEDNKVYDFEVNLDEVEVTFPDPAIQNKYSINDTQGITMRYPSAKLYKDSDFLKVDANEVLFELIVRCVDTIWDGKKVFKASDSTKAEMEEFVDSLDTKTLEWMTKFLTEAPRMKKELKYTNSKGTERTITLSSLSDFFSLS